MKNHFSLCKPLYKLRVHHYVANITWTLASCLMHKLRHLLHLSPVEFRIHSFLLNVALFLKKAFKDYIGNTLLNT